MPTSPEFSENDKLYMRRALELAEYGAGHVSPNPMVGAVIVSPDGRIIGEGWHRRYGEGHAEVNAMASVKKSDQPLISQSTVYVTLEPCSHYGKTPPCAKLLIEKGVKEVVVGLVDPFAEVSGRGIRMLRDAGIKVRVGCLEDECRAINSRFLTAHSLKRPHITLKWAQTSDGYIASFDKKTGSLQPMQISNELSQIAVHRLRAVTDAIMVGTNTIITDNPRLDNRLAPGNSPRPVYFSSPRLPQKFNLQERNPIVLNSREGFEKELYAEHKITSLLVEGGATILKDFIAKGLYDIIRVETSPITLGDNKGLKAPELPAGLKLVNEERYGDNIVRYYAPCGK